jgi:hypothetical protein
MVSYTGGVMSSLPKQAWFSAMSNAQRLAWFNLGIVLMSLCTVLSLAPALGFHRAQGGLGLLGFLGLAPFLFRKKPGKVFMDERDVLIQFRAWGVAYFVFWMVFIGVCVSAPFTFGSSGTVPVELIQMSVWYGIMIVWGISGIVTLAQYHWGSTHAAE